MKLLLQVILSVYLISVALAQICETPYEYYGENDTISSGDDFNRRFGNCTTIVGSLHIARNYSGSLILHDITNVTGHISISAFDGPEESMNLTLNLTSIEANVLVSLGDLILFDVPALKSVAFPKLETIGSLEIDFISDDAELSFPSLFNATSLELSGPISRMDFSSLSTVTYALSVSSNGTINPTHYTMSQMPDSYPPLDIDFPALQNCSQLFLYGNISSVSMPLLESSIASSEYFGSGITITTCGNPLDLIFPKLWNVTQISLFGTIGSFSFPSLTTLPGALYLTSFYPISFDLAPLESATILVTSGNLTSLGLDSLKTLEQISIDSQRGLDCGLVAKDWARIHNVPLITDPDKQYTNSNWKGFRCHSTAAYRDPHSSEARKLGLGLGIGLGVPVILVLAFFLYRKHSRNKAEAAKPPPYEHELDDRHHHEEAPPTYAPRHVSESNDAVSDVSSLSDVGDGPAHHGSAPPSLFEGMGVNEQGQASRSGHEA